MDADDVARQGELAALEEQLEAGGLYTHTALSRQAERMNRMEAMLHGLIDLLVDAGQVTPEQIRTYAGRAGQELRRQQQTLSAGVVLRLEGEAPGPAVEVDCARRMPVCQGICCRLSFPLSAAEVEAGRVRWHLGQPYYARKDERGACVHQDGATRGCTVYNDRPTICRTYSCKDDTRIWKDFEGLVLNVEWIAENLRPERPRLVRARMDRIG